MEVRFHPRFSRWLKALEESDEEAFAEVMALIGALEAFGRELSDEGRDESHPVVTSDFDMHALRRTPPTRSTPYATGPPVLRILYGYCRATDDEVAVVLVGGDKTDHGNRWYPPNVAEAERRLKEFCVHYEDTAPKKKRGRR